MSQAERPGEDDRDVAAPVEAAPADAATNSDDDGGEPPVPVWAFALIFLGPALILTVAAAVVQWWESLASSPLAVALVVGHLLSVAALAGAYVFVYRRRRS